MSSGAFDPRASTEVSGERLRRPKLLVVDDSRFVRASLVRALESDFALQQADCGERAWELLLLDDSIAAVLSDLAMPGMDGFELLQRVRESVLPRIRSLPFVVLSGGDDPAHRERANRLGANRFVVKGAPFDDIRLWMHDRITHPVPRPIETVPLIPEPVPDTVLAPLALPVVQSVTALAESDLPERAPKLAEVSRIVPDPLHRWFRQQFAAVADDSVTPVLIRLDAPGLEELAARLRRGVRAADALHQDGAYSGWLFVPATPSVAVKLALRFGLLAAGRSAGESGTAARVAVSLAPIDRRAPVAALESLRQTPCVLPGSPGISIECLGGPWGERWRFETPWSAARLLIG